MKTTKCGPQYGPNVNQNSAKMLIKIWSEKCQPPVFGAFVQNSKQDFQNPKWDFQNPNQDFQNPNEDFQNPKQDFQNPHLDFPVAPGGYHHLGKRISQTQKGKSPFCAEIAAAPGSRCSVVQFGCNSFSSFTVQASDLLQAGGRRFPGGGIAD